MTNSNAKKLTKRDYFKILKGAYPETASNYDEVMAFIDHELELLDRKNSSDKKPTVNPENEKIKVALIEGMEDNRIYTITELIKEIPACAELTNQKVSAIVRTMLGETIERLEEKGRAYFRKIKQFK